YRLESPANSVFSPAPTSRVTRSATLYFFQIQNSRRKILFHFIISLTLHLDSRKQGTAVINRNTKLVPNATKLRCVELKFAYRNCKWLFVLIIAIQTFFQLPGHTFGIAPPFFYSLQYIIG